MSFEWQYFDVLTPSRVTVTEGDFSYVVDRMNDLYLDQRTGTFKTYSGLNRVKHELVKITLTSLGEDFYDQYYGCGRTQVIGKPSRDNMLIAVQDIISTCIKKLMTLQAADSTRLDSEVISNINSIVAAFDNNDHRIIIVSVDISTKSGASVAANVPVKVS